MGRSLPARSDDEAESDLCLLERGSTPATDAVRTCGSRASLAALASELAADPVDRAEMDEVRALVDELASEPED
jgi:hypothetical protein